MFFLASCGDSEHPRAPCAGFGCEYDLSTADGLRFRNHPPVTTLDQLRVERIAAFYRETETCAAIVTGGPLIIAVADGTLNGAWGYTYFDAGVILMVDSVINYELTIVMPTGGAIGDPYSMLKHEFIHYLLAASGFSAELNAAHASPLFRQCAGI
jgi:hypothetical protein